MGLREVWPGPFADQGEGPGVHPPGPAGLRHTKELSKQQISRTIAETDRPDNQQAYTILVARFAPLDLTHLHMAEVPVRDLTRRVRKDRAGHVEPQPLSRPRRLVSRG